MEKGGQMEFVAETGWFHFYSDLVDSGELADMNNECRATSAVLLVMKRHMHEQKFRDWGKTEIPSISILAKQSGFSRGSVSTALGILEKRKFIRLIKPHIPGTKKRYEYYDRILIRQKTSGKKEGNPVAGEVMIPYEPKMVMAMQEAMKNVLAEMNDGSNPETNSLFKVVINKEYKNLFVQNIAEGGTGTQTNTGVVESVEKIKKEIESISAKIESEDIGFKEGHSRIGELQREIKKLTQENETKG
jgi:DNA-binding transcriptional MocR family regulator